MKLDTHELTAAAIAKLDIPEDAKRTLVEITAANADAWRATVLGLSQDVHRLVSMMERMQTTLTVLVEAIKPELKEKLPAAFSLAPDASSADVASALVVADPIAAGFTLSQKDIAERLAMTQPDVSVLVRAFGIDADPTCAVVVSAWSEEAGGQLPSCRDVEVGREHREPAEAFEAQCARDRATRAKGAGARRRSLGSTLK